MNLNNQAELETYFADNFDTVLFPILADMYLNSRDLVRARKVCEIGLGYHPDHVDGRFILAMVELEAGNTLMPRSWPSNPGFAITIRIFLSIIFLITDGNYKYTRMDYSRLSVMSIQYKCHGSTIYKTDLHCRAKFTGFYIYASTSNCINKPVI